MKGIGDEWKIVLSDEFRLAAKCARGSYDKLLRQNNIGSQTNFSYTIPDRSIQALYCASKPNDIFDDSKFRKKKHWNWLKRPPSRRAHRIYWTEEKKMWNVFFSKFWCFESAREKLFSVEGVITFLIGDIELKFLWCLWAASSLITDRSLRMRYFSITED